MKDAKLIHGKDFVTDFAKWGLGNYPLIIYGDLGSGKTLLIQSYLQWKQIKPEQVGVVIPDSFPDYCYQPNAPYSKIDEPSYYRLMEAIGDPMEDGSELTPAQVQIKKLLCPSLGKYKNVVLDGVDIHLNHHNPKNWGQQVQIMRARFDHASELGIQFIFATVPFELTFLAGYENNSYNLIILPSFNGFYELGLFPLTGIKVPKNLRPKQVGEYLLIKR